MNNYIKICLIGFLCFFLSSCSVQNNYGDEDILEKESNKDYKNGLKLVDIYEDGTILFNSVSINYLKIFEIKLKNENEEDCFVYTTSDPQKEESFSLEKKNILLNGYNEFKTTMKENCIESENSISYKLNIGIDSEDGNSGQIFLLSGTTTIKPTENMEKLCSFSNENIAETYNETDYEIKYSENQNITSFIGQDKSSIILKKFGIINCYVMKK